MSASCVYEGVVSHRRLEPVRHEFAYRIALLYLDLDELPDALDRYPLWSARRPAPAWFRRADHFGDPGVPLADAVRSLVAQRTGTWLAGPVRLLTHLRYFGHCFNPVSFYYCYDADGGSVRAVVAEVTNTPWGEQHVYLLRREPAEEGRVVEDRVEKQFHVSPFMAMDQRYDWRVVEPGEELLVHIDALNCTGKLFDASLTLRRRELDRAGLRRVLWRYPAATFVMLARIYVHALRLRLKGAPYFPHPERATP